MVQARHGRTPLRISVISLTLSSETVVVAFRIPPILSPSHDCIGAIVIIMARPTSAGSPTQEIAGTRVYSEDLAPLGGVPITVTDSLVDTETNAGSADT